MPVDVAREKQQAHALLDSLTPDQLAVVSRLLKALVNPSALSPLDDEPVTEEDRRRFREGQAWLSQRGGKGIPMEEVLAEFGLKMEDFPLSAKDSK